MSLSRTGRIVLERWRRIPEHADDTLLDAFVVMPNHVHGLLLLAEREADKGSRAVGGRMCFFRGKRKVRG